MTWEGYGKAVLAKEMRKKWGKEDEWEERKSAVASQCLRSREQTILVPLVQ